MADPQTDSTEAEATPPKRPARRRRRRVVAGLLGAAAALGGIVWWTGSGDDATELALNPPPSGATSDDGERPAEQVFPLGVGSRWEYAVEYTTPISGPHQASAVAEVLSAEELGGREYRRLVTTPRGVPGAPEDVKHLRRREDGVYRVIPNHLELGEALLIPSRPAAGQSWQISTPGRPATFRILGREHVETPAGRFECWKVEVTGWFGPFPFKDTLWVADGVGIVKQIQERLALTVESELTSYRLTDEDDAGDSSDVKHSRSTATEEPRNR